MAQLKLLVLNSLVLELAYLGGLNHRYRRQAEPSLEMDSSTTPKQQAFVEQASSQQP